MLAFCAAVPAPALGSTAVLEAGDELLVLSGAGEQNDITVGLVSNQWTITDAGSGGGVFAFAPCAVSGTTATCPALGHLFISTGDLNDRITIATGAYEQALACGGAGDDTIVGGSSTNALVGGPGDDALMGGPAGDVIQGEDLCPGDIATGAPGQNSIDGGGGDDALIGGAGSDSIHGGPGADTLEGLGGDDALYGGDGADNLFGDAGMDLLVGGDDSDFLNGGTDDDQVFGGTGDDVLGQTTTLGGLQQDAGNDALHGQEGDDTLYGGPGPTDQATDHDDLSGGPGRDAVTYSERSSSVEVTMDGVANDGSASEGDNLQSDVEVAIGGSGDDRLIGGAGADTIDGGPGNDALDGGLGDDSLLGDSGNDSLFGDEGRDSLHGNDGDDRLDGGPGQDAAMGDGGNDEVKGSDGDDTLEGGPGLDSVMGGPGDDHLEGGSSTARGADSADTLDGGPGNDALSGGRGRDRLVGGTGSDTLTGGEGADLADYSDAPGQVHVTLDGKANDGVRGEQDNVADDVENVRGDKDKSTLAGGAGSNLLDGGPGEDLLEGGRGSDDLRGGADSDVIRSRDGLPDRVECGPGSDFAIVDRQDIVSQDCEWVDGLALRNRERGQPIRIRPTGVVTVSLPAGSRSFQLEGEIRLPLSTRVNARDGSVAVELLGGRGHIRPAGVLSGGSFVVHRKRKTGMTDLHLMDRGLKKCQGPTQARRNVIGFLSGRIESGLFRARGRYASVRTRRARWEIEDRCDSTRITVLSGRAVVFDLARRRTVTLARGHHYEARG
jgi:Ca2+-binding RTX toxin-like protein